MIYFGLRLRHLLVLSVLGFSPMASMADAGTELARSKQCMACHQVDIKRVGPAFKAVAERYAGTPGAEKYLATSITEGSRGKWGAIPMPAQAQVNPADAAAIAAWILSLAEQPLRP